MSQRVAVVTGSNKGIGFAIVKKLCKKFDGVVYLTARNPELGNAAVAELKAEGLQPKFHQLDISNQECINQLRDYLQEKYNGLDVLVNNAGMAYKKGSPASFAEQAENSILVNYAATRNVCNTLFPLLRPHARVVNVSSFCGMLSNIPNLELKRRFASVDLTIEGLNDLLEEFVQDAKQNTHVEKGWGSSAYNVSKVGVTALSKIQQRQFNLDSRVDLIVNAVNPGHVATDMSSHGGRLTPAEGASAPSYLALLPADVDGPKGEIVWNDKRVVEWGLSETPQPI